MAQACDLCADPITAGQRADEYGGQPVHAACLALVSPSAWQQEAEALVSALRALFLAVGPVRPEHRCMGKKCHRRAEYAVSALDENMGAYEYPVRLCRRCLTALDDAGAPVDVFRWLSDNRIEATA